MQPFEVIAGPLSLFLAPVGTAFPLVNAVPASPWFKIGTNGDANYTDDGVTVTHTDKIEGFRPAGRTGMTKSWRTEEDLMIGLTLADISLEQYALALNGNAVATTAAGAGTAGTKQIGLSQGPDVKTYALLARGYSPYADGMVAQYQVARCYQSANPKPVFKKGVPAGLELEFTALENLTAATPQERFGQLVAQHQAAI